MTMEVATTNANGHEPDKGDRKEQAEDLICQRIGSFGRWHIMFFLLVIVPVKFSAYTMTLGIIFLAPRTTFRCLETNATNVTQNSTCYSDCVKYEYYSQFESTIISQWNLVCERAWLANLVQTLNMCGVLIGSIAFGYMSDRTGRRPATLAACLLQLLSSFATSFCSEFWMFAVTRFVIGTATAGNMICSFVILTEMTGQAHRELAASLFHIPLAIGEIALPVIGYYLRKWDTLSMVIAAPTLMYLSYFWILLESPKWLISFGRVEDASLVMTKVAKCNKLPTADMIDSAKLKYTEITSGNVQKKATYIDLLTVPHLRRRNLFSCISWLLLGATFYGCTQYVGQTSSNVFVTMSLTGALKIPILLFCGYSCKRLGRRCTVIGFLVLSAICCGVLSVPDDWFYTRLIAGTFGVNFVSGAFTAMYMFTSELFPTVARNMAMGATSTASRVGSALAPIVVGFGTAALWLPSVAFGVMSIVNIGACSFLPETKGKKMANTLYEQ